MLFMGQQVPFVISLNILLQPKNMLENQRFGFIEQEIHNLFYQNFISQRWSARPNV
jgi:hypothetical protein